MAHELVHAQVHAKTNTAAVKRFLKANGLEGRAMTYELEEMMVEHLARQSTPGLSPLALRNSISYENHFRRQLGLPVLDEAVEMARYAKGTLGSSAVRESKWPLLGKKWDPPRYWNGPVNHGEWLGPRGNSGWIDNRAEVIRIVGTDPITGRANPIIFYQGEVQFSQYAKGKVFDVRGLTGTKNNVNRDMKLIMEAIAEKEGLPSASAARRMLRGADDGYGGKGLAPHHAGGDRVELVPASLHKVQHTDITH